MRNLAANGRRMRTGRRSRTTSLVMILVFVWLMAGVIAGAQRDYYNTAPTNCAGAGTIAVTIIAGPLNYLGMNPRIEDCNVNVPQPSR
ncbi:hypothetical protein [Nocardia wallacei]|uniref:hypothetical protein n=1 Tax=Nocardia wallacei TaxID=480035 RepID=UPI00245636F7|nr:hypothetical protein [Nocardia wallacei]